MNYVIITLRRDSIFFIWILVICLPFLGCNVYREIEVKYDKKQDFSAYKTFAWLPDTDSAGNTEFNNDFIRNKTKNYIGHCMDERDYKIELLEPDLLMKVTWLDHPREVELNGPATFPEYYDPYYYNDPDNFYIYNGPTQSYVNPYDSYYENPQKLRYSHGGVVLDVIDRKTKETIWHGVALGDLYDPKVLYRDLHPAIHKMMRKFPSWDNTNPD